MPCVPLRLPSKGIIVSMKETLDTLKDLQARLQQIQVKLDPANRAKQIADLEQKSARPDFWSDAQEAQSVMKRLAVLQKESEELAVLEKDLADAAAVSEIVEEGDLKRLTKRLKNLEIKTFLNGMHDASNAILSIHAGQGGTEAQDWSAMLLRMYLKYGESRGWNVEVIDEEPGEEAGYKSVTVTVTGPYAYGYLKGEAGTHRLVRLSPFNADSLRQTSFSLVEVLPEMPDEDTEIEIKPDDVTFEAFRSTGHGGQNVNKVSTAVRLTHKATGIIVTCQTQRSQEQNRKIAMQLLKGKLWQRRETEKAVQTQKLKGSHKSASWGTQIRSYVLHPYQLVKDVRTEVETSDAGGVLDGDLDMFIEAEVRGILDSRHE